MKRTPLKKHSSVNISVLKRKLLEDVKKLIRESGPCVAQGQGGKGCGGYMHPSHIKSEGAHKNLFVDPRNILPLCYTHHIHWWHKEPTEAAEWFKENFPRHATYLEKNLKYHIDWTPEIIQGLRTACKIGLAEYMDAYEQVPKIFPAKKI